MYVNFRLVFLILLIHNETLFIEMFAYWLCFITFADENNN